MIFKHDTLPDKKSELLKLALRDLELAEKSDKYVIDMDYYYQPNADKETCTICLAGSVMAFSLNISEKLPESSYIGPNQIDNDQIANKLRFIDAIRGNEGVDDEKIQNAVVKKIKIPKFLKNKEELFFEIYPEEYEVSPKKFKKWIKFCIKFYEANPELDNNGKYY